MTAEQATIGSLQTYRKSTVNAPVQLKVAERPVRDGVRRLLDLALSLVQEAEGLARDEEFTDEATRLQTLDLTQGLDFYREVERFETGLIKLALDHTGGNQSRAAKLLQIKPTTLNSKIKLYRIEY
jgi:DNA-binding NtrC family response regulator